MISQDSSKFHYFNRMSGKAILTDKNGNIYYTGTFYGTVDFDPGSGTDIRTATSTDVFLSKLDSNGNLVWFSHFETILRGGYNYSQAMTLDGKNHLLISGIFQGIIDFDPGPGIDTISSPKYKNQYSEATYICKYDLNGNHIWAKRIGALYGHCGVITMNSDTLSNVYLGGSFWGKVDFDPDTGTFIGEATPGASSSGFLTKLDSNGYFSFAKIFIPNYPDYNQSTNVGVTNINIKNNGNILLSGGFTGKVDFDPDTGKHYLYSHSDQNYLFIIELNHIGALNWVIDFDGLNSGSMPVAMDDSDNIYIAAHFGDNNDLDPGPGTFYLPGNWGLTFLKLDQQAGFQWAFRTEVFLWSFPLLNLDKTGNLYMAGDFYNSGDFDPGPLKYILTASAPNDGFIYKLNGKFLPNTHPNKNGVITVYPNPTDGQLGINLGKIFVEVKISVLNELGKVELSQEYNNVQNISLDLGLARGLYFVKVTTSDGRSESFKIIKI